MIITMGFSKSYGYEIEFDSDNNKWIYSDTKESISVNRPCKHCSKLPTEEGYDGCLGYIPNVQYACCGHGTGFPYIKFINGEVIRFNSTEEIKEYIKKLI